MKYELVISPWCVVQIHYNIEWSRLCVCVHRMHNMMSAYRRCVCIIGVCLHYLKLLFAFDEIWGYYWTRIYCQNIIQRTAMTSLHLCLLNVRNGVALTLPARTGRKLVLVCAWIWNCYLCSMRHEIVCNLTLVCCPRTLQRWWRLCCYVRWIYMEPWPVGPGQTGCTFVLMCVCIRSCYSFSMQYECVCKSNSTLSYFQIYRNCDGGSAFMFVKCMQRWRVDATPTGGTLVLVCDSIRSKMLFVFDVVWGRNFTLMRCANTL